MRKLNPDEEMLWARVTATIRPLSRNPLPHPVSAHPEPLPDKAQPIVLVPSAPKGRVPPGRSAPSLAKPRPTIHGSLDSHWDRRLRSGTIAVDRTLDLHGHSLERAWEALDRALEQAVAAGDRVLLLVTGHHRPGEPPVQRGKIRAAVHDWLAVSRHADRIAAVRSAHKRHGGGGSLYLILRR
ncbi:Smr/MutS family protein [Sphingomonas sp. BN140010]|uniref:Smr/MutS family protein n=1 Tax=Sphingomonas arvum TaxID=2992113 RepID=A0ABT3JDY6_9SPHN|nr:Smr/MutS family protein [Sphingomonas sp. BN140010]MCW3797287.1 Smr/MutS family protein [Sphingomonas sp. BN140010]